MNEADHPPDLLIPAEIIDRDIAAASALHSRWTRYLEMFRKTGRGRLRIGDEWETAAQAESRLITVVDHHARTIEILNAFRARFPDSDA